MLEHVGKAVSNWNGADWSPARLCHCLGVHRFAVCHWISNLSLEPAYQFLLPVFCPYCEAVLLEAVFLIKMMFDVNEARWKVSTFFSICQLCSWYVLFSAPAWDDDPAIDAHILGWPNHQETIDILCWILVAKRLEDTESYDGVSPPAPRTINCKGKILRILFFVLPKVVWA